MHVSLFAQNLALATIAQRRSARYKFGATVHALRALLRARLHVEAATWAAVWALELGGDEAAGRELLNLVGRLKERHFVTNEVVIREGELVSDLYVITRGRLQVERRGAGRVARLGAGDVFGEGGLLEGARRMATVRAERGAGLLVLNAQQVHGLLRRMPRVRTELSALYRHRVASQLIPPGSPFSCLAPEQRDELLDQLHSHRATHGELLVRRGRVVGQLGVVLSGVADVWQQNQTLARLVPGDLFGVRSLLTGAPSTVSVEAVGPVQYYSLQADICADLLEAWPLLQARLSASAQTPGAGYSGSGLEDLGGAQLRVMRCPYCRYEQVEGARCTNCGVLIP